MYFQVLIFLSFEKIWISYLMLQRWGEMCVCVCVCVCVCLLIYKALKKPKSLYDTLQIASHVLFIDAILFPNVLSKPLQISD